MERADGRARRGHQALSADTIFALSSGAAPAAIAVVRISGPNALAAAAALGIGELKPRRASLRAVRWRGETLDQALVLFFARPGSATGEDIVELHLHGGRATVAAVLSALAAQRGLRQAGPGEFTRRALANGVIDLWQAEGLADLLAAETEAQRKGAAVAAGGGLGARIERLREQLLDLSAQLEAAIDYSDEGDVEPQIDVAAGVERLRAEVVTLLVGPPAERLRDGFHVVIAGPPNAGKSTLINALAGRQVALTSSQPGTTRDRLEAAIDLDGLPIVLIDTAGLREDADDEIEAAGIQLATATIADADLLLWLGDRDEQPEHQDVVLVAAKCDIERRPGVPVSARTGQGLAQLQAVIGEHLRDKYRWDSPALAHAHRARLATLAEQLRRASNAKLLVAAEELRIARTAFDELTGRDATEQMLERLFARFCVGK